LANTLHNFLTGKIVEKNYTWLPSRNYIFGTAHRESGVDGEVEKANTSKGNNTLDLTYTGSFIWSDPKRLVETKPGNMVAKDLNCLKATVAVDVEQNDAAGTAEGCNRCYEHEYDECDWCDECGPTAKVDNWLQELLDRHHQLLRQQGCLTYTGRSWTPIHWRIAMIVSRYTLSSQTHWPTKNILALELLAIGIANPNSVPSIRY